MISMISEDDSNTGYKLNITYMLTTVGLPSKLKLFYLFHNYLFIIFIKHNVAIKASIWEQGNSWLHPVLCNTDKLFNISQSQFSFAFFEMLSTIVSPCIITGDMKTSCFYSYCTQCAI